MKMLFKYCLNGLSIALILVLFISAKPINDNCTFTTKDGKEIKLYGKVQFVDAFPDIKVQIVDAFPDIEVQIVNSFPDHCGKWQIVNSFPNIKVQIVDAFPDIKVKFVNSFPGLK